MTEIPEHLLRRSRERRAALSGGEGATEQAAAVTSEAPAASPPVVAPAAAPPTQTGGGGAPAPVETPAVAEAPEVAPRLRPTRVKTPLWMMPILLLLPVWMAVYMGAFGNRTKANANDPVTLGGAVFTANCATCHGANGEGGVGPQLNSGQVLKVWPKLADHINWVHTGGAPFVGKTIGATNIPVPANNVMPGFGQANGGNLTDAQIADVVCYERVTLGGAPEDANSCPTTG